MVSDISVQDNDEEALRRDWIAEEEWHIRNATTDLSQFMRPLEPGQEIADAELYTPEAESVALASLWSSQPALLITGSMSCPPSRLFNVSATQLHKQFGDRIQLAVLYVIDAHPDNATCPYTGTNWLTSDNERAGILVNQPQTQDERNALAREYRDLLGLECPLLVDNMANTAWNALGRSPNMAVLIDTSGRCVFWQDWIKPDELTDLLGEHLN